MDRVEFMRWFGEDVAARWPKWQVGPHDIDDWYFAFSRFERDDLIAAIRRHKLTDAPSRPSTKRLIEILRARTIQEKPMPEVPADCVNGEKFWQIVRTQFSKEQRLKLICDAARFHPHPRELDEEAFLWAIEEGKIG